MSIPPPEMKDRVDVLLGFAEEAAEKGEHMFYIRIPVPLEPLARGEQFEDPLQHALSIAAIGEVTGGGSQLGDDDSIVYCGIDVIVTDRTRGLEIIRSEMRRLGAPEGTVIEEFLPAWAELPL